MESKKPSVPIGAWLAAVLSLHLVACGVTNECSNVVIDEFPSPGKKLIATLFERNCGATTAFSTIVSIRGFGRGFDGEADARILVLRGRLSVGMLWANETNLNLRLNGVASKNIFRQETNWKNVFISY